MSSDEENVQERRLAERIYIRASVHFQSKNPEDFGGSLAYDISEGGIRMNFNDFVPLGTELNLSFQLENAEMIECTGRVMWIQKYPFSDRYQAGLKFEAPDNFIEAKNKIHKYIQLN